MAPLNREVQLLTVQSEVRQIFINVINDPEFERLPHLTDYVSIISSHGETINELKTIHKNSIKIPLQKVRRHLTSLHMYSVMALAHIIGGELGKSFKKIQREGFDIFRKKNMDYGDSFSTDGPLGVIVRLGDKINRIKTIHKKITAVNESIRDTLADLMNYSAMAIMLIDES